MTFARALRRTAPAVVAAAVVGGIGTRPRSAWFQGLRKPRWQPPPTVFGPAWTVLYALIAVGTARAMTAANGPERRRIEQALWINLGLNAGWCWLFFTARRPGLALAEIVVLDASNADLLRRTAQADWAAGAALAPYVAWTAFATAPNGALWQQNR